MWFESDWISGLGNFSQPCLWRNRADPLQFANLDVFGPQSAPSLLRVARWFISWVLVCTHAPPPHRPPSGWGTLSPRKKKKLHKQQWLPEGLKWHDLAQNPRVPHVGDFLHAHTPLTHTPSHTKGAWYFQPMAIKSENNMLLPKHSLCT